MSSRASFQITKPDLKACALRAVANGEQVGPVMRAILQTQGLIEASKSGWSLTTQGRIALLFARAR